MTFTRALATNNYGPAKFIVDGTTVANGTHSTIAAALTSASSGDTIFIRPGTYTENLTLKAGVNLTAYGADASLNGTGNVIISGTCTLTGAGSVTISGIQLQTNSAALLAITGSAASIVNLYDCFLNCTNNTGITFSTSSSSGSLNIFNCSGNLGTTGIALFSASSAGTLNIYFSNFTNTGASTTASTHSAGTLTLFNSFFRNPLTTSGTSSINVQGCSFEVADTTTLTIGGSGGQAISCSNFTSGTASAISISSSLTSSFISVSSSNTNAITGAGTHYSYTTTFTGTSLTNNITTQNGGIATGLRNGASPTAGWVGERLESTGTSVSLVSNTAKTICSVSLTAGVWDVTAMAVGVYSNSVTSAGLGVGISTATNTLQGTLGIQQYNAVAGISIAAGGAAGGTVPAFRVTLSSTTTYYCVAQSFISAGTLSVNGRISATRVG